MATPNPQAIRTKLRNRRVISAPFMVARYLLANAPPRWCLGLNVYVHGRDGAVRPFKSKLVEAQESGAGLPVEDTVLQRRADRQAAGLTIDDVIAFDGADL